MRQIVIILVAVAALVGAAPASAHLVAHPKCKSLACREASQKQNLAHARYVCDHGAHQEKRWSCHATKWLKRELKKTEAVLHPVVVASSQKYLHESGLGPWGCIHRYEGAWDSNTGNGYYGGLQMDYAFMKKYGASYLRQWGTADKWPVWAQIDAARRARDSGRGYYPWPNTARMCGLI
jgi:hypothetical protein